MQAPRVPEWGGPDSGDVQHARAQTDAHPNDDTGELTPLVLALGVLLVVAVVLMALVGVNAIGGSDGASGSALARPVDWSDEAPARVSTGVPRNDRAPASDDADASPDADLVDVGLAASTSGPTTTDTADATETTPALEGTNAGEEATATSAPSPESSVVRRLEIVEDIDESQTSSARAVALTANPTTTTAPAPAPTTGVIEPSTSLVISGTPAPAPIDSLSPTTTQLVAAGADLGGLAVDIGETTAIVHWQVTGPIADISGFEIRWSCCGEDSGVEVAGSSARRYQLADLRPSSRYLIAVTALDPNGETIDRTTRTRTITTKRSGLGVPPAAYDVRAVAGPGPNQVTVKWSADADEALGGFFVSVGCCGGPVDDKSASVDDPSARVHVINRLDRDVTYAIDLISKDVNFIGHTPTAQRVYISLDAE